jgi:8-oxo-dGTP diphosphatase
VLVTERLPGDHRAVRVVGAAIVRDATVLAARRKPPHRLAGGWEFPGGKVEPGEGDATALARECVEELGVDVVVGAPLAAAAGDGLELLLYAARLVRGEPAPLIDHDELRWLTAEQLDAVDWLPIDRELLPAVRDLLTR